MDLIIIEIISILQWFNPFIWFIKKDIQNTHEFEADMLCLKTGINAKEYQLLLIKEAVGPSRFESITNNFNQNKTKKRITMMLKEKSPFAKRWKYLAILPLVAISITLFANTKVNKQIEEVPNIQSEVTKNTESIVGTWKLLKSNNHDMSTGRSTIKIITKNTFSWQASDANGIILSSAAGKYTYLDGVYTEYLDNTSNAMKYWKGKTGVFNVEIKDNIMTQKGMLDNKVSIEEEWIRIE